ncbi:hypothetical protein TVAG_354770 [Trichomonas vaginalis G3]|uniref:Ste24 endopeptidase n=1 Tax=Trichomonas vaginalis (strain ATCC PRA-98 / G3) TaxID=412133 RepID=A2EFW2_TRIV3|nr:CAAX prenyl protease 1 family [Trichomonas vaginalis G3]EAY08418.1 hypothetical protein TVAG_354770 [Trichomonas vaginalis G3]KAI5518150.1 CAAX prenyl protease 1 family [Trichomonas vaginalis G3]|eukprot:XP_001320641.1 hypothetical protein [Trichomonas vaginalis G3]
MSEEEKDEQYDEQSNEEVEQVNTVESDNKASSKPVIKTIPKFKIALFAFLIAEFILKFYVNASEVKNITRYIENKIYSGNMNQMHVQRDRIKADMRQDFLLLVANICILQFSYIIYPYTQTDIINMVILILARYGTTIFPLQRFLIHTLRLRYSDVTWFSDDISHFPPRSVLFYLIYHGVIYIFEAILFVLTKLLTRRNSRKIDGENPENRSTIVKFSAAKYFWLIHWIIVSGILYFLFCGLPRMVPDYYADRHYLEKYSEKNIMRQIRKISRTCNFPLQYISITSDKLEEGNIITVGGRMKRIVFDGNFMRNLDNESIITYVAYEMGKWYIDRHIFYFLQLLIPYLIISILFQIFATKGLSEFGFKEEIPSSVVIMFTIIVSDSLFYFWSPVTSESYRQPTYMQDCFVSSFQLPASRIIERKETPKYVSSPIYEKFHSIEPSKEERLEQLPHCKKILWPKVTVNI